MAVPPIDGPPAAKAVPLVVSAPALATSLLASYAPVRRNCAFGEPGLLGIGWTCGGSKAAYIGTAPENGLCAACGGDDRAAGVPVPA